MGFKCDFVWGSASAAIQVEGAALEHGRGMDIWTAFSMIPGKVFEGNTPLVSSDQYHRLDEDIRLMKEIGMKAYRFSISWPRVLPEGTGKVNEEGISYYNSLINKLLENDIEPYITLYHWDLPEALQKQGGWQNPHIVDWFGEYTRLLTDRFSDRVKNWMTLNEPACITGLGLLEGVQAPGLKLSEKQLLEVVRYLLLAHGTAVKILRENAKQPVQISMVFNGGFSYPETDNEKDVRAARNDTFSCRKNIHKDVWNITLFADPVFLGRFPDDLIEYYGDSMPKYTQEDMALISQPLDYFSLNIYWSDMVKADADGNCMPVKHYYGFPKTAMQWSVTPECMYWIPKFLYERYGKPIYITENGMSSHDWICLDGKIHDGARTDFLHRYLLELRRAVDDGVPIAGYFVWSLLDNFEWAEGYNERFGIIFVDYNTLNRTRKDSSYFIEETIRANGTNL